MKLTTCKNIDVECEVEVDLNDVLIEWSERLEAMESSGSKRSCLPVLDGITRLIERIPGDVFLELTPEQWEIVSPRIAHMVRNMPTIFNPITKGPP